MQIVSSSHPNQPPRINLGWRNRLFGAKAAQTGGIIRRKRRDADREIGRAALMDEVQRRGFHLLECGDQYVIICHGGELRVLC